MAFSRRSRQGSTINIWPGFVDALTQLTMVMVFVLLVFMVGQFYLSGTVTDQDAAIKRLNQQINALNDMLAVETRSSDSLRTTVTSLETQLRAATDQKDALEAQAASASSRADQAEQNVTARDASIAELNQNIDTLKQQLADIAAALELSKTQSKAQQDQIADLGNKLNLAMANKVEALARYRSEFFGRLREILGDRPDIRIVGDRFVFQSEVLFTQASAELSPAAQAQLMPVVKALKEIAAKIPDDVVWILEVDGHTDHRRISTPEFPSNWELSTARAVSVVNFLIAQGIPAAHLSAAGFGEWQPLDAAATEDAFQRNRRIELKLTQR